MRKEAGNDYGFTVVELIVVVGVISLMGLLSEIVFHEYRVKVAVSEGKSHLAFAHVSQQIFHSEQSSYTACLGDIGAYDPAGDRFFSISTSYSVNRCGPRGNLPCNSPNYELGSTCKLPITGSANKKMTSVNNRIKPVQILNGFAPWQANYLNPFAGRISLIGRDRFIIDAWAILYDHPKLTRLSINQNKKISIRHCPATFSVICRHGL